MAMQKQKTLFWPGISLILVGTLLILSSDTLSLSAQEPSPTEPTTPPPSATELRPPTEPATTTPPPSRLLRPLSTPPPSSPPRQTHLPSHPRSPQRRRQRPPFLCQTAQSFC